MQRMHDAEFAAPCALQP